MFLSITHLAEKLGKKEISPVELLQSYLSRIESLDSNIHAFIELEKEQSLEAARESEKRIQMGKSLSPLDGIPIGIKDNIVQKGRKTQCASKILEGFISPYSASVIEKLEAAGMLPLGRLNMDEFAMGSSTENSSIQVTRNPHDTTRAPGGSSGGSAAAVSAGFLPAALGSDTGGSIRQPASFTGIVGLKPTYGCVSRYGLVAFASSLDQIGPLTRTVEDCELIYKLIKGYDPKDSTSIPNAQISEKEFSLPSVRIGIPTKLVNLCSKDVQESFYTTIDFLRKEVLTSGEIKEIDLPLNQYAIPVYYLIATSEASANLARFDGIRYGRRAQDINNLSELYEKTRTEGFGSEVKRRILLGTYALSSGYYDAFYGKAQRLRKKIQENYIENFTKVDVILLPSAPTVPFRLGEKTKNPVEMYKSDILTVGASLAGIPAISIPGPFEKLPIGIQLQGNYFSESLLFSLGKKIEQAFPAKQPSLPLSL